MPTFNPNFYDPQPANNMASSSFLHPPANAVEITLTPRRDTDHRRTLFLRPNETVVVGRSSRSEIKNLSATRENALFDCPVVSRVHAELRAPGWPASREVTITDRQSLHGTTVNGNRLSPGRSFTLNSGDVIKLGERVTRGDDTHEGVSLTFTRVDDDMAYSNYPRDRSPASNTFIVPSEDASDFESDAESEDINYNDRSSAKTTPEQPKPANPQGRDFIDLSREDDEDDEDEYEPMAAVPDSYQPSQLPQEPVVIDDNGNDPEDLDDEDHELVMSETSVDFVRKPEQEHPLGFLDGEPEAANEDRAAAINTGLAQFLCERHARLQERAQDKESDFAVPDYNVVAADVLSDNASEALDTSQVGVGAQVENNFWFANRPASPEPGEQSAARQPTEGARFPTSSTAPTKASKPRYDPVREEPNTSNDLPEPSQADNSFQHDFYSFAPALATHYSNAGASGWQTRSSPAVAPWHRPGLTLDALQNAYTLSSLAPRESAQSERQPERGDTAASMMGSFASKQNNEPATLGPTHASAYNGKISITQLLEEQGDALDQAHEMVKEANNATMAGFSSSGTKRKAVETEIDGHVETSAPPSKKSRPTASAQASTARTHRRRSTGRGIVRRIAEGAAGAFLGAAATVAFLSSPYAELLIDWLD